MTWFSTPVEKFWTFLRLCGLKIAGFAVKYNHTVKFLQLLNIWHNILRIKIFVFSTIVQKKGMFILHRGAITGQSKPIPSLRPIIRKLKDFNELGIQYLLFSDARMVYIAEFGWTVLHYILSGNLYFFLIFRLFLHRFLNFKFTHFKPFSFVWYVFWELP